MSISLLAFLAAAQAAPADKPPASPRADRPPPVIIVPPPPPPPGRGRTLAPARGAVPAHSPQGARPSTPLQNLVNMADYPPSALRGREQGRPRFRLTVGPDGRVTGCVILVSSGSPALDSATCRIMRSRARFSPAVDGSGRPVEDQYWGEIAWRIERQ